MGSISCDLLSTFSQTLPDSIQTELDKYTRYTEKDPAKPDFYDIYIEGLYEDKNYSERIPNTYTAVDKDIYIYIGTVEASVVKNESDYDIFVYSQQPVSEVSLGRTTLSEYTNSTNPLIKQYKVTKSPAGKDLYIVLKNGTTISFTINL